MTDRSGTTSRPGIVVASAWLCICLSCGAAERSPAPLDHLQAPEAVLEALVHQDLDQAVEVLTKAGLALADDPRFESAVGKLRELLLRGGEPEGWELAAEKRVSRRLCEVYYLLYADKPILFSFRLYLRRGQWRLQAFNFNSDIEDFMAKYPLEPRPVPHAQ